MKRAKNVFDATPHELSMSSYICSADQLEMEKWKKTAQLNVDLWNRGKQEFSFLEVDLELILWTRVGHFYWGFNDDLQNAT